MTQTKTKIIDHYKDPIYDMLDTQGSISMGDYASFTWRDDPKHLLFSLSRYKFCAKMLNGKNRVMEVGCGDAFCFPIMLQSIGSMHGVDMEPVVIENNKKRLKNEERCSFEVIDATKEKATGTFDAIISMDVIEHIPNSTEDTFMQNICSNLTEQGVVIIGTPNVTAKEYASEISNRGHVNLKSGEELHSLLDKYFHNTFSFSMNDEVVHTGFTNMAHYIISMGVGVKK